jgi:hypothetical protein
LTIQPLLTIDIIYIYTMGNVQSELISEKNDGKRPKKAVATTTTSTINDYDPKGAVIPDINPCDLLRTLLQLEKLEGCLSCVPLTIDTRSPKSRVGGGDNDAISKLAGGSSASKGGKGGGNEKDDMDIMSTIEEGDDDDDSKAFMIEDYKQHHHQQQQKLQQQQQQQHGDNSDAWIPAKFNKDDPSASLWHSSDASRQHSSNSNQVGVNKSSSTNGSYEFSEFNPDKILEEGGGSEGEYGSAEYTEFDPDAILAAEEEQQQQQQQQQQSGLSDEELDDVLMMRYDDENYCDDDDDQLVELFQNSSESQSDSEPRRKKSPSEPFDEPSEQHVVGLTDPMDVAQRACNAMSPTNAKNLSERYQVRNEVENVEQLVDDIDEYDQEEDSLSSHSHHEEEKVEEKEEEGSESDSNQFDWTVETESDMHHITDWRDNHQLTITTEVDDANKIANKHFDDIISDFELSPRHTQREKAYSNVRSWMTQRAHKKRRSRRMNDTHADDMITKTIYSPQTSDAAFFAEETIVGRKLNGISPKVARFTDCDASPSDEVDTNPAPVTQSTNKILKRVADVVRQVQDVDHSSSSYHDDGLDASVSDDSLADASLEEQDERSPSYPGDETGTDANAMDTIASDSYSAEETVDQSVDTTEKGQKIKYSDLSGESTSASSSFESTHAKLKGLLKKASYESDSVNDTVNWDNLDYSISDGSIANNKSGGYALDQGASASQSQEEETYDQRSPSEVSESEEMYASYGNEENVTPTFTTKQMEDKIKQMKKQHEDEMKSYVNQSHDSPRHLKHIEVQRRIDAMREQHKTNIDNMRAALKKTNDNKNPSTSSSRFNFDDNVTSKFETREKSIQELMKQNAKLEEEMRQIRALSPRSPDSSKFSPKYAAGSNAFRPQSSRHNIRRYSPRSESPESYEAREALSTMILDANADEEQMNIRVNGMIADIKSFLQENDKVQKRLEGIVSYGV